MQNDQPNYEARARATDPVTSHMAAAKIDTETRAGKVLAALKDNPQGLSNYDLAEYIGEARECTSPCLAPLERQGYVHRDGTTKQKETGMTVTLWQYGPKMTTDINGYPRIDLPPVGEKIEEPKLMSDLDVVLFNLACAVVHLREFIDTSVHVDAIAANALLADSRVQKWAEQNKVLLPPRS